MTTPPEPALPEPAPLARWFGHDPGTVYLNHGSFGACPAPVLQAQRRLRDRMEADAVRFFVDDLWPLTDRARKALAPILGTDASNLALVPNATTGVTTALHNLTLRPGDEVLATSNEYTACLNNTRSVAGRAGATVVVAPLPWPVPDEDAVVHAVLSRVTPRTRAALVSLVTSATGLRLPVERLIPELSARGVDTILDAAHGPGCVPMHLDAWRPAYATGNCHKWLCAPKGAGVLYVAPDRQDGFRPLVLSNDAERLDEASLRTRRPAWHHEFDYTGTDDYTARLTIPDAAGFLGSVMPGGLPGVMAHNRDLCLRARDVVCDRLGVAPPAPDAMLGPMATIILPGSAPPPDRLKAALYERWRIQIPVWSTPGGTTSVRLSAQIYNSIAQYEHLATALAVECRP